MSFNRRWVEGKRIVSVLTERVPDNCGGRTVHLDAITLEDGSQLRFVTQEAPEAAYYIVHPIYVKSGRRNRRIRKPDRQ